MRSLTLSALIVFIFSAGVLQSQEANQTLYTKELNLALQLITQAKEVNGLWRDTRKLVEEAKESAKQEDYKTAISLLQDAQLEAGAGYKQAINQNKLDDLVPYYLK